MIIRALEGFLLYLNRLPTLEEIDALDNQYLRGDPMLSVYPALGECIGTYDGDLPLPDGWEFRPATELPPELHNLLLVLDQLADLEWEGTDLSDGLLEAVREQVARETE